MPSAPLVTGLAIHRCSAWVRGAPGALDQASPYKTGLRSSPGILEQLLGEGRLLVMRATLVSSIFDAALCLLATEPRRPARGGGLAFALVHTQSAAFRTSLHTVRIAAHRTRSEGER